MSIWALRGLRDGIVTTRWPRRPDEYADSWRGPVTVLPDSAVPGPTPSAAPAHGGMSGAGGAATSPDISGNGAALVSGLADVAAI